jgi:hypothetical protein
MDGKYRNLVGISSVGRPSKINPVKKPETLRFVFHDFKNRKEKRGEAISPPALKAYGFLWKFQIYPRGNEESSTDVEYISCFLNYVGDNNRKPTVGVAIRCKRSKWQFEERTFSKGMCIGRPNYYYRENILDIFLEEDGSLVFKVDLQISIDSKRVWYPEELQKHAVLNELYQNAPDKTADVVFVVEGKEYHAHKNILSCRALALFDLCEEYEGEQSIPISDMKGETFEKILMFVYTVKLPEIEDATAAVEFLLAADRFDCTDLKLYVESIITDRFLSVTNAAFMLILGDSHSCALLKEAAMDLHASDTDAVMKTEDWHKVQESKRLLTELFKSASGKLAASKNVDVDDNDLNFLDVTSLREQLEDAKLEVDGSREIIIERLKNHQQRKRKRKRDENESESEDEDEDEDEDE